jgi:triacylglycerol lipase
MLFQFPPAHWEYLAQFAALRRDPIYRGHEQPRGHGEPVLLIPGFLGGDWMLLVLARWLRRLGYRPYLSGIHVNGGIPLQTMRIRG